MKKTRIVGLLLVFVLVTSCFVGGTFAKYASQGSGSDKAVVAKWSINVNSSEIAVNPEVTQVKFNLFDTAYELQGDTITDTDDNDIDQTENYIAPGTGGEFELVITNNSQVTAKYTVKLTHVNSSNIPLEYSLDGINWNPDISQVTITNDNLAMNGGTKTETVYWRWQFNDVANLKDDNTDTALGISAQTTAPTITVTATIYAEQVD